jgi:hypothetical protein
VYVDDIHQRADNPSQPIERLSSLDRKVTNIRAKQTALPWLVGGLGTLMTLAITVGKAFHWF